MLCLLKEKKLYLGFYGLTGRMGMASGRCCFSGPGADDRLAAGLRSDGRSDRPPFSKGKRRRSHGSRSVIVYSIPVKIRLHCCRVAFAINDTYIIIQQCAGRGKTTIDCLAAPVSRRRATAGVSHAATIINQRAVRLKSFSLHPTAICVFALGLSLFPLARTCMKTIFDYVWERFVKVGGTRDGASITKLREGRFSGFFFLRCFYTRGPPPEAKRNEAVSIHQIEMVTLFANPFHLALLPL